MTDELKNKDFRALALHVTMSMGSALLIFDFFFKFRNYFKLLKLTAKVFFLLFIFLNIINHTSVYHPKCLFGMAYLRVISAYLIA